MTTQSIPVQYRHGDVFIQRVDTLPNDVQPVAFAGDIILALGEVTGHAHRIAEHHGVEMWSMGDQRYITVAEPSDLTHEEHGPITLPPGTYQVKQQRVYTPEAIRTVRD